MHVLESLHFVASMCRRKLFLFNYIIVQTYEVGLHSRRHLIEIDAGTRPFASLGAPSSFRCFHVYI